jgi:hypothetical protein
MQISGLEQDKVEPEYTRGGLLSRLAQYNWIQQIYLHWYW